MHERALFRRFPQLHERLPWIPLAHLPTPVEPLPIAGRAHCWVKRDDISAEPYGGNKVRKLEFLLGHARARGARRLITVGAAGSHHALATTIYGKQLGFDVTLVLFPQPLTQHVRDILLLDQAYGAELRYTRRMEMVPAALFATSLKYRSQRAFNIPPGGSDAIGTLGYVDAALELAEQIAAGEMPEPTAIVVAAGTLGTAAGLALGLKLAGITTRIRAVRITSRIVTNERVLARLIRGAETVLRRHGVESNVAEEAINSVELLHTYIGRGYGHETPAGAAATASFEQLGLHLDPTYTAKAAAAMIEAGSASDETILFWQTLSAAEPTAQLANVTEADLPAPFQAYLSADA